MSMLCYKKNYNRNILGYKSHSC